MNMENKFQEISQFIEKLEKENLVDENEQSLLLVGGNGSVGKTNTGCKNFICLNNECDDSNCSNGFICA